MVDHLQGGFQSIQFKRAAEHPDFNRICIREIDRRVTSGTGILRVVHLLGRRKANAVSSRPAVHLGLRTTAEPQQFCPEFLDKIQQASNRGFLLFIGTAECQTRNVNVQAARACRMAEITHALRFTQYLRPRHFIQMVLECHRVCDKLEAFIQTAVRLDVEIFGVGVRDVEQLLRIAVDCTAVINFELNAEMTQTLAMKNKVWRVAVFVNNLAVLIPAGCAVGVVVIVPIGAVTVNNAVAVLAADVILIKAVVAKRVRVILDGVFLVDPLSTVVADYGQAVGAILAEPIAFRLIMSSIGYSAPQFAQILVSLIVCSSISFGKT